MAGPGPARWRCTRRGFRSRGCGGPPGPAPAGAAASPAPARSGYLGGPRPRSAGGARALVGSADSGRSRIGTGLRRRVRRRVGGNEDGVDVVVDGGPLLLGHGHAPRATASSLAAVRVTATASTATVISWQPFSRYSRAVGPSEAWTPTGLDAAAQAAHTRSSSFLSTGSRGSSSQPSA